MPQLDALRMTQQPVCVHMGYFPLRGTRGHMRYATTRCHSASIGTILLLIDRGETIEHYSHVIEKLQQRRLHVALFDWFGQGGSDREKGDKLGGHISDFRELIFDVSEIFTNHFLPDLPAPFYVLGSGMGGLLALAAHDMWKNQIRRMVLLSPLMQPARRSAKGSFHHYARLMSDLGFGFWRTNTSLTNKIEILTPIAFTRLVRSQNPQRPIGYPTLATYATLLDAVSFVLSPEYCERMSIPSLFVCPDQDPVSPSHITRQFAENLRLGAHLTLRGAPRDILHDTGRYQRQFWRIFDAFIPGSGASSPPSSLEEGVIL